MAAPDPAAPGLARHPLRHAAQLAAGCAALGAGIALLLRSTYGADGFSLAVAGLARVAGAPFGLVNALVGLLFVGISVLLGVRPGPGTIVQPVLVGVCAQVGLATVDVPLTLPGRAALLALAFAVLAVGIAAYLAAGLGAGPLEALAAGLVRGPVRFAAAYSVLQVVLAGLGWALGARPGVGTLIVVVALGPAVAWLQPHLTPRPVTPLPPTSRRAARSAPSDP